MRKWTPQVCVAGARALAVTASLLVVATGSRAAAPEPDDLGQGAPQGDRDVESVRVAVGYRADTWEDRFDVRGAFPASLRYSFPAIRAEVYEVPVARLDPFRDRLASDPRVAFVEADTRIPLALNDLQWNFQNVGQRGGLVDADVDGPEAWAITTDCHMVTVALVDTGMDLDHPDLVDNVWVNPGETGESAEVGVDDDGNGFVDDVYGWNFRDDNADVDDIYGHGTHVAGIIGAEEATDAAVGGVCRSVRLMPVVAFGFKMGLTSDVVAGIIYAVSEGADVVNGSFEGYHSSPFFDRALAYAADMGVVVVLAAGNDGVDLDAPEDAAGACSSGTDEETEGNVIVVAATNRYDELADFSNYGSCSVDLGAPGESIYSTFPWGGYRSLNGTSMAAPHVAGAAAMILTRDPCLTPEAVRTILMEATDPLGALADKVASGGRLNLYTAVLQTPVGCR